MASRIRWMEPLSAMRLDRIVVGVIKDQFGPGSTIGFRVTRADSQQVHGSLIERIEQEFRVESPVGEVFQLTRVEFPKVDFKLDLERRLLELQDPPRHYRELLNRLSDMAGVACGFVTFPVGVWKWWREIQHNADAAEVTRMEFTGIASTPSIGANYCYTGIVARDFARARVAEFGEERLTSISGVFRTPAGPATVTLSSGGVVRVGASVGDQQIAMVQEAMVAARLHVDQGY